MTKSVSAFISLLVLCLMAAPARADFCLELKAPGTIESKDIDKAREELSNNVLNQIKKSCGEYLMSYGASIEPMGTDAFSFDFSFKYGMGENDLYSKSLIYDRMDGVWTYRSAPEGQAGDGVDLNADGVPEKIKVHEYSMRTYMENGMTILAADKADGKYKPVTGLSVFDAFDRGLGCQDGSNYSEEMDIDRSAGRYPLIVLRRIDRTRMDCPDEKIYRETWKYQWDEKDARYAVRGYENTLGEKLSFVEDAEGKVAIFHEGGGPKMKLGSTFSKESTLFAFFRHGDYLYFKAEDAEWLSEYAWQTEGNKLFYMAKKKKTGKVYMSKGNTKAIFDAAPWVNNVF